VGRRAPARLLVLGWIALAASCAGGRHPVHGPGAQGDFTRAKEAYEGGHHTRAIELLEAFERNHPGSQYIDDAFFYLGKSHQASREQLLARQAFQRLLDAFPRSSFAEDALFEIAHSWFLSMRGPALDPEPAEEAIRAFRSYLRRYPEGEHRSESEEAIRTVLNNLADKDYRNGRTYMRLGRPGAARRYFEMSLSRWDEATVSAKAREGIARSYEKEDRWPEARAAYESLLEHLGDDPDRFDDGSDIAARARQRLASLPQ